VFPNLFPDRRTAEGKEVVDYTEFMDYLLAKAPGIECDYLQVEGRNRVLYRLPAQSRLTPE
jgi:hypothetical protein